MAYGSVNVPGNLPNKQDALTGHPGQLVGFDSAGAACAVRGYSNPNILINADFRRVVNQRGVKSWSKGIGIDCWRINTTEEKGMYAIVNPGYITLQYDSGTAEFYQIIEDAEWQLLQGSMVTLSCMINNQVYALTTVIPALATDQELQKSVVTPTGWVLGIYCKNDFNTAKVYAVDAASTVMLQAMKLESGDHQTLAHQDADGNWVLNDPPPDMALELAKCQRHQFVAAGYNTYAALGNGVVLASNSARIFCQFPSVLRARATMIRTGDFELLTGNGAFTVTNISLFSSSETGAALTVTVDEALQPGEAVMLRTKDDIDAKIIFDANL